MHGSHTARGTSISETMTVPRPNWGSQDDYSYRVSRRLPVLLCLMSGVLLIRRCATKKGGAMRTNVHIWPLPVVLVLASVATAQGQSPASTEASPPTPAPAEQYGAVEFRGTDGQVFLWERPEHVRYVLAYGCGGGGGGAQPRGRPRLSMQATGGEGAPVSLHLVGPLKAATYTISLGSGGQGARLGQAEGDKPHLLLGVEGTPTLFSGEDHTLRFAGGLGGKHRSVPTSDTSGLGLPLPSSHAVQGAASHSAPGGEAGSGPLAGDGGGAGLGRGGNGGTQDGDGGQAEACGGGGGAGFTRDYRRARPAGNGGPGYLKLFMLHDPLRHLSGSEPQVPPGTPPETP